MTDMTIIVVTEQNSMDVMGVERRFQLWRMCCKVPSNAHVREQTHIRGDRIAFSTRFLLHLLPTTMIQETTAVFRIVAPQACKPEASKSVLHLETS